MAAPGYYFRAEVGDTDTQGSSTSYLVTVFTNLDVYSEHGAQVDLQVRLPRRSLSACELAGMVSLFAHAERDPSCIGWDHSCVRG